MTDTRWQLVAYVFVSIILWMVAAQFSRRRKSVSWVHFLSRGWAASISRFAYYVGLPYAALILGVVPGRYLGLVGLDRLQASIEPASSAWRLLSQTRNNASLIVLEWLPDLGIVAGLAVVMLVLLGGTWLGYSTFLYNAIPGLRLSFPAQPKRADLLIIKVLYQAVHWSFYRSAVWLLTDDLYLGVIGGVLLVGLEWVLEPGWAEETRQLLSREERFVDASVLIASSVVFFFVPNFWLLLPTHWLLTTVSRRTAQLGLPRVAHSP